jgi:hypothetical protein
VDAPTADPSGAWAALGWTLLFLLAYAITVLVYWLLGHQPVAKGWLTIPRERWYLVQTFTTVPVGLAGFLSCAGLMYFLCRAAGGRGSLEATFAVCAYAIIVPCVVFMLILEMLFAPVAVALGMKRLPWPEWVELLRVFVLPFAWIFALSALSVKRVHGTHAAAGLAFTVLALVPTAMTMAVFIR